MCLLLTYNYLLIKKRLSLNMPSLSKEARDKAVNRLATSTKNGKVKRSYTQTSMSNKTTSRLPVKTTHMSVKTTTYMR